MPKPNKPNPCGVSRIWKWNSDFLLAGMMEKFYYLKPTLVALLIFIGAKMLVSELYKIPMEISMIVIFTILGIAFGLSAVKAKIENTSHVSLSKQDFDSKKDSLIKIEIDSRLRFESMNVGIAEVVVGSTPTQSIFYYEKTTALF